MIAHRGNNSNKIQTPLCGPYFLCNPSSEFVKYWKRPEQGVLTTSTWCDIAGKPAQNHFGTLKLPPKHTAQCGCWLEEEQRILLLSQCRVTSNCPVLE